MPTAGCASLSCRQLLGRRVNCGAWRHPVALRVASTLVIGTGSHVLEVPGHDTRGAAFDTLFARRAAALASFLVQPGRPTRVVYLLSSWGELNFTLTSTGPTMPLWSLLCLCIWS